MPERESYPAGVPCWVDTSQPDPKAAAAFYGALFGWDFEDVAEPGAYRLARLRGLDVAGVGGLPEGGPPMPVWNTYVRVDSADAAAAKVRDAGGRVLSEPFDVTDAGRMAVFADPEGAVFCVWEPRAHPGARVVNEPGAVVFNTLRTRDVEAARRFYGAVFGWETLDMGGGDGWRLPGYGDHLEQRDPGFRQRVADLGGPEGFEDVVASIERLGDDQPDVPPHWNVVFATADADATARRAAELGGRVVAGPFDAPWVRMAVIADPAGATFTASQFVPENRHVSGAAGAAARAA